MENKHLFKKTKVICTIGPSSESEEKLKELAFAGMNIARMNFSHGTYEEHKARMESVRRVSKETGIILAVALDTKGPEIRLGDFANDVEQYEIGEIVTLVKEPMLGSHDRFHVQVPELFEDLKEGNIILINDGKMRLSVLDNNGSEIKARIEVAGPISSHKGCNVPGVKLSMPFISEKDEADLRFGCRMDVDFIFAKIENQEGYDNIDSILEVADGVMVARGDLGVEIPTKLVPIYQKHIIKRANVIGKPAITATHMLDSMTANPRCTRAEASDVCNAVLDGSDGVMLSAESAAGSYPVEACATMSEIAEEAELVINYAHRLEWLKNSSQKTVQDAVSIAISDATLTLDNIAAIVVFTQGGTTARRISKFRPAVPVLAVTFKEDVQRRLLAYWGVMPILSKVQNQLTNDDELASDFAKKFGVKPGQQIIISAGYPTGEGSANMMKIITVK